MHTGLPILVVVCVVLLFLCILLTQMHQTAKGANTRYHELADLPESIERLLKPLDIHALIPPTLAVEETMVKIIVELISTLALTAKELKLGRSSESVLTDELS